MYLPCDAPNQNSSCVDIAFETATLTNFAVTGTTDTQSCLHLDLSNVVFDKQSSVLRCLGAVVTSANNDGDSDGGNSDGEESTPPEGDGEGGTPPEGDDSGDPTDTDCSGEGETWGPGIAIPPEGCSGSGGRRLESGSVNRLIPDALIISLYDRNLYDVGKGRMANQLPADDQMAFIEWKSTSIIDKTSDITKKEVVFDGSSMTTGNAMEDDVFSLYFRPQTFTSTEINKSYHGYMTYLDDIGGYTGAVELGLGLIALVFYAFRPVGKTFHHMSHEEEIAVAGKKDSTSEGVEMVRKDSGVGAAVI